MSTVITGDPSTITTPLSRTVTGATNASPIVITTSASHLFATGDVVRVSGVLGNTAANGTRSIIKLTSTTFSLTGSTGNGAYTSGGTALDLSLTPQFTIPSDGDVDAATSVNVALEALADRTQWLARNASRMDEILVSGTWTCPANVFSARLCGCGGGGGGGEGSEGTALTDHWAAGGSGGGAAPLVCLDVPVVPGTVYTVTIGAGGTANSDGGTTFFGTIAMLGGGRGRTAFGFATTDVTKTIVVRPGTVAPSEVGTSYAEVADVSELFSAAYTGILGSGGAALSSTTTSKSKDGEHNCLAQAGGIGGFHGSDSGSYRGGGGGGGGGAGPFGVGGDGADGPDGNNAGPGSAGGAGTSAPANSGGGGGGGAAGSSGTSGTAAGGAGAAGGSGRLRISYVGPQAVIA